METDKQLYRIFGAQPEWVFQLAGLPPVGKCVMRSLTVKSLERRTDGVIVPQAPDQPLSVVEFQFGESPFIYTRIVQKMAAIQEEFGLREVQGIVFFAEARFDPHTKPWTNVVRSIVLIEELHRLAKLAPEHPLVAVFQPLLAKRESDLEHTAGGFFRTIRSSKLKEDTKAALEEVFVSWLGQRLPQRSKKEIEDMLLGELPALVDTRMGRDILKIGEERGRKIGEEHGLKVGEERGLKVGEERGLKVGEERGLKAGEERGLVEAAVILLEAKRGRLTKALRQRIQTLGRKRLRQLVADAIPWESLEPLDAWLAAHDD